MMSDEHGRRKRGGKKAAKSKEKKVKERRKNIDEENEAAQTPVRDRCRSKKFQDIWKSLPGEVKSHYVGLSRSEQTSFIHDSILRTESGKLIPQTKTMYDLIVEKEENQKGLERMAGFVIEDCMVKLPQHPAP